MASGERKPRARAAAKPKAEAAPKRTVTRARKPKVATEVRFEHVAERAYFLWENGAGGDPTAHWLQAEHELAAA
jgi:Protein of unknown function (DUF2934)